MKRGRNKNTFDRKILGLEEYKEQCQDKDVLSMHTYLRDIKRGQYVPPTPKRRQAIIDAVLGNRGLLPHS